MTFELLTEAFMKAKTVGFEHGGFQGLQRHSSLSPLHPNNDNALRASPCLGAQVPK